MVALLSFDGSRQGLPPVDFMGNSGILFRPVGLHSTDVEAVHVGVPVVRIRTSGVSVFCNTVPTCVCVFVCL